LDETQWEFFDYGYLKIDDGDIATFHTIKSKLLVFNVGDIRNKIMRKVDSDKHVVVVDDNMQSYLLYNNNPLVIDILMDGK
jgi:hypothetical protein